MIYTIVFFSIFVFSAQGMAIEAFMILTSPDKIIYKIDEKDAPYKEIITKGFTKNKYGHYRIYSPSYRLREWLFNTRKPNLFSAFVHFMKYGPDSYQWVSDAELASALSKYTIQIMQKKGSNTRYIVLISRENFFNRLCIDQPNDWYCTMSSCCMIKEFVETVAWLRSWHTLSDCCHRIGPWLFHDYFFDSFENYLSGGEEFFDVGNGSWHRAIRLPASCLQRGIKEGKLPKLKQQLRAKKVSTLLELYHFEKDPRYKELFALIRFEDKVPSLKYLAAYAVHVNKKHPSIKNFKQVLPAELLDQIELYASDNASYELLNCKWGLVFSREDYC